MYNMIYMHYYIIICLYVCIQIAFPDPAILPGLGENRGDFGTMDVACISEGEHKAKVSGGCCG
jgi:hypothetical protein